MRRLSACVLFAAVAAAAPNSPPRFARAADDDGSKPLFNGTDLTGWVNVNCHPDTFFVKDGEIVTTGKPTGFLRTDRHYENFVLEFDWMHVNKKDVANSGLFVWGDPLPAVGTPYTRGIEVQVLINYPKVDWATNHGDIFSIHGAKCVPDRPHPKGYERCLPSEERVKGGGEWNHYKVTANDGVIKLEVNGKEVSGVSKCSPRKGYLALESEGAECHFKNIKIKELPSTNPKPEEVAKTDEGFKSIFNGLDLKGWKTEGDSWKAAGGALRATGKAELVSEKEYGLCEVSFDCKLPAKADGRCEVWAGGDMFTFTPGGNGEASVLGSAKRPGVKSQTAALGKPGEWTRVALTVRADRFVAAIGGTSFDVPREEWQITKAGAIVFKPASGLEIMNMFLRELK